MDLGNVLIIGDSYSTFEGFVPEGYRLYYTTEPRPGVALTKVEQTWWHRLLAATNANLILNNSWSGSTIGYTGYNGEDNSKTCSFIYRLKELVSQGFFQKNRIDTVFVFGGTNDNWCGAPLGENKTAGWEAQDLYCVRPAVHCFMTRLRQTLPDARIYSIINTELADEIVAVLLQASAANGIRSIQLQDIQKENGHPTIKGMSEIYAQVLAQLN